ncbi:unnamed protein product [Arabidopsis lyrata]|uniref:Uncharacterized protein n=1 Tax=Arabidopsis lyrata subsp. lyrata TaxID=81972 RepID=D7L4E0_ARALL|nr:uncharacterized protein LOC9319972 [Arabidopsis lyrata subsp. lyrata]EFH60164.1 hypothetical protein ARALYDRAFT_343146 [Arabidopsis lyrata subsp. lyrata]CAH8262325.1 unnamed protein product [Arabidopsis lyrata]|eukprot:XP_002883905.1 uncharacterized protein LOC9319972 [Arabidopsis lyrata subsp. lyrata]
MSNHNKPQPPKPLMKQQSLPLDVNREEAWLRMKKRHPSDRLRRSKSCFTSDDIEELKGCFDLGFGFEPDSPDFNPRLSKTIPALDLYSTIQRQYSNYLPRTSSSASESDVSNSSTTTIVNKDDDGKTMKKKLKQWAKVVACSARHSSGKPN